MKNILITMVVCAIIQIVTDIAVFDLLLGLISGVFALIHNMLIVIFQSV